ncbi:hypothetical protein RM555_24370 [Micromonospora sp. DSM 115977]|uniref:Uncharacterized protein n=1 Tax=Micromonospora reichwaldensis TaxID=3075516 RepID=A0ABU2X1S2_9ACTN|nr:hypothetical protein [Micromonospora sp. DSM 115977]MDT0532137.1 hypothetical protein [Micromonospora sp. DSM 115977]
MTVFGCRICDTALTVPVSRVALPVHAGQKYGNGQESLASALEPGTFAVNPLPSGSPWRRWAGLEAGEAEALGWYAPRFSISAGPVGRVLLPPGDARGAVIDPALVGDSACCGLDGGEPNMVCVTCGTPVAIRIDDCGLRQAIWLDPLATHVLEDGPGPHPVLDWVDLIDQRPGIPPSEPGGGWHPLWAAAAASALAHLLAASGGDSVVIPDRQVAEVFRPTLNRLVGPGNMRPERTLVLAGPGIPDADGHFALIPEHPQTGELWPVAPPVEPIPLAWDAWRYLAFHRTPKPVGRSVPIPPEALPALIPGHRFEPDGQIFLSVLARLPEVRQPRLRAIYDRGRPYSYTYYSF